MNYRLGVDLGTTWTAAAVARDGAPAMLGLGNRSLQIPSVVFVHPDGGFLVGEAAERQAAHDPTRVVREFKRRLGDPVPILVAGTPFSPQSLSAKLLRHVVDIATEREGGPPELVTVTHPANWGRYKLDLLRQVLELADLDAVATCSEPEAAARQYVARSQMADGDRVAVYDLGGGTFDVCVLEKRGDSFELLGSPQGIEHLGGIDFDEAVFAHVAEVVGDQLAQLDHADAEVRTGLADLRRACVEAKEALSIDTETVVRVALPGLLTSVRLVRSEFEDMIRPALEETVEATGRAVRSAGLEPEQLHAIVLIGGSSRIPLVQELLSGHFGCPVARDTHPKHDVALGAARVLPAGAAVPAASVSAPAALPVTVPPPATPRVSPPVAPFPEPFPEPAGRGYAQPVAQPMAQPVAQPMSRPVPQPAPAEEPTLDVPRPGSTQPVQPVPPQPRNTVPPARVGSRLSPDGPGYPGDGGAGSPGGPGHRLPGRTTLIAAAAAAVVLVAGTVFGITQLGGDDDDKAKQRDDISTTGQTTQPSPSASTGTSGGCPPAVAPAGAAAGAPGGPLPKSAPLAADELVWPGEVARNIDIYRVNVDNGCAPTRLTDADGDDSFPVITPDRSTVIYTRGTGDNTQLWTMAVDGSGKRPLVAQVPDQCRTGMTRPAFGKRADQFLVVCRDGQGRSGMFILDLAGTIVREIPMKSDTFGHQTWSSTGRIVFFANNEGNDGGGQLISLDENGGDRQVLTTSKAGIDAGPAFSPDGSQIAFRRYTDAKLRTDIWVMNADGSNARPLTAAPGSQQDPSWSPDGKRIAYKSAESLSAQPDIFIVDVATKKVTQLVKTPGFDTAPAWTDR